MGCDGEHHKCDDVTYYDWDWDVTGDVLDTKWCHIHQVDEGSIELHSAWNAPTKLIKRISQTFGRYGLHIRIEDNDWGVIGDAKTHSLCGDDCFDCNKKSEHWQVKCLTATYYQKFVAALKGKYKSAKELLEENTFYNDDVIDNSAGFDNSEVGANATQGLTPMHRQNVDEATVENVLVQDNLDDDTYPSIVDIADKEAAERSNDDDF